MATEIIHSTNSLEALLEQMPLDPDERGKLFERVTKWWLKTDPSFASQLKEVWLWDDWPENDGPDVGIDIVAQTYEGNLWAIQVKCYGIENEVPTSHVDRFLSKSAGPEFSHRLLISTGPIAKLGETTLKQHNRYESTAFLLRRNLINSPVNWLSFLDELQPALPEKKAPRNHQKSAINDVLDGFECHDRGRLIMACGTGKTLVGVWVSEKLESSRTLVLIPSISLIEQVSREWLTNSKEPLRPLFVYSDPTAGNDSLVSSTSELGIPPTTDPEKIQKFMSGPGKQIVFATYHSSPQVSAAQALGAPTFDLAIADEAHHCAGKVDTAFSTILDPVLIKASKRLFMTATPRHATRRLKDEADKSNVQVVSMDDVDVFGPEMHLLSFGQAIDQELLSDYQVLIMGITDSETEELARHRRLVELLGSNFRTDASSLAHLIGMIKALRNYDLKFVLTFHNRINRAKGFISALEALNDLLPAEEGLANFWSRHISGNMTSRERNQILQQFETGHGRTNLLSNAKCLGEGVDVPGIDGIGFIDPKRSTTDIIQAVGRAIRKSGTDKTGTIVLPVLLDQTTDLTIEEQLEDSRFDAIWNVLNALRAHDDVLAENLDSLRYELGRHGRIVGQRPGKIVIDLPTEVGMEFVDAIETKIALATTTSWEFWYGLLTKYNDEHQTTNVPAAWESEDGFKLGDWCSNQRARKNRLTDVQINRLDSLGFIWDPIPQQWEAGLNYFIKFRKEQGHSRVSQSYGADDGYPLGQ